MEGWVVSSIAFRAFRFVFPPHLFRHHVCRVVEEGEQEKGLSVNVYINLKGRGHRRTRDC